MAISIAGFAHGNAAFAQESSGDPLEPLNRAIFSFNETVDGLILDPAQQIYGALVPDPAKTGIRNFLDNLRAPVIFANDVLQGEGERAGTTLARFLVNSTFGIGGIFDAASGFGIGERHDEDFGQTLGTYGIGEGPYLVLPLLGPSSLRDVLGLGVDSLVISPWGYAVDENVLVTQQIIDGVDTRYRLDPAIDDLNANSLDAYVALRSVYRQRRSAEIRNGVQPEQDDTYEDIFDEDF